jgi:hypothetical protein
LFWLREFVRDGGADEFEGFVLEWGGCGEDLDVGVAGAELVAGEGGEFVEERRQTVGGLIVGGVLG